MSGSTHHHDPASDSAIRRLYMDNAATSFPKPKQVHDAMLHYATQIGASAGRGGYAEAVETASLIADCRFRINTLLHGESPDHVVFTLNCSDALNLAIHGLIQPGRTNHVICTAIDHNSILRPYRELEERGTCTVSRIEIDPQTGLVDPDAVRAAITRDTKLIATTHVSNVTGTVQPIRELGRIAREHAVPFLVDGAQSAGHLPVDVQEDCIDLFAAPGHKGLLGPLGTGFLYMRPGFEKLIRPIRQGGTGSVSEEDRQPDFMPDRYEPGSHNAIGLIGLSEGVSWVMRESPQKLHEQQMQLVRTFIEGISTIDRLTYYGPQGVANRAGVFSVRIEGLDPHELSAVLESGYGILTRSGIHCAPHAHRAIGTHERGGTTRFSFGPYLTRQDVKFATDALAEIAMSHVGV